jgi:hypothetical protein
MPHRRISGPLGFAFSVCSFPLRPPLVRGCGRRRKRLRRPALLWPSKWWMPSIPRAIPPASSIAPPSPRRSMQATVVAISQGAAATVALASSGFGLECAALFSDHRRPRGCGHKQFRECDQRRAKCVSAVGCALGRFGGPKNVPSNVTAVATGQRVVLPPGTTLSFVLAATAPVNVAPAVANATPVAAPAANNAPSAASTTGPGSWYQCRYWGENGTHQTVYVTPFIQTDAAGSTIHHAYYTYMHASYPVDKLGHQSDYCRQASSDAGQRAFQLSTQEKQWATSNPAWEVIHIDWTYTAGAPRPAMRQ